MKRVQPIRRALGFRTIFNLAGPLTNPAGAPAQVIGVYAPGKLEVVAGAMARLGVRYGRVVHARNGIDEIALSATDTILVRSLSAGNDGDSFHAVVCPEDVGMAPADLGALQGCATAKANAAMLERILEGAERGPRRDVVLLNAAAALEAAGLADNLRDGVGYAAEALNSGATVRILSALREFGRSVSS
jgi:anthranilate phosphoribosyltransferase